MCFSATASFTSCAILGVAGIASLKKTDKPEQKLFAAIPFLFSVQQLAEGFVWLSFSGMNTPPWQQTAITFFLVFALIIWPLWIPLSVIFIEENKTRKVVHYLSMACGLFFASFALYDMFHYPMSAQISNYHVHYKIDFPNRNNPLVPIIYILPTIVPLVACSIKRVPVLGLVIFTSYLISRLYFGDYVISVWCFFAAIMSGMIYLMVTNKIKAFKQESIEPLIK